MQDPEAQDDVEALVDLAQREGVEPAVLGPGAGQLSDRAKARAADQLASPPGPNPVDVLLVVDGQHPTRPPGLGQERVEPVERSHVEHREPGEARRERRQPVAVVAGHALRVDPRRAIEGERVEPQGHPGQRVTRGVLGDVDRKRVGDGALSSRDRRQDCPRTRYHAQSIPPALSS